MTVYVPIVNKQLKVEENIKMIKLEQDGYCFISTSGITYDLLEGVTMGANQTYTSDIIFIMLQKPFLYKVDSPFVDFFYGAFFINESLEECNAIISEMVLEYERRNNL